MISNIKKRRLVRFFHQSPWWLLFLFGFVWRIIVAIIVRCIFRFEIPDISSARPIGSMFMRGVFWAPIAETIMFQLIPMEIILSCCKKIIGKQYPLVAIGVSALLFGICHYYSFGYVLLTFLIGLCLSSLYFIFKRRSSSMSFAALMTALFHFFYNLASWLFVFCFRG